MKSSCSLFFCCVFVVVCVVQVASKTVLKYTYKGRCEQFIVPPQVGFLTIEMAGAAGGHTSETGVAYGARMKASVVTNPGEIYYFCVGGVGGTDGTGGWNGGGDGYYSSSTGKYGCGGGGATDIRRNPNDLSTRILIASGGGGAGVAKRGSTYYFGSGGQGGCSGGHSGGSVSVGVTNTGGIGGNYLGAAGGTYAGSNSGSVGTLNYGGAAGVGTSGGGGGGGYYGGGGGSNNGGGGGNSLGWYGGIPNMKVQCFEQHNTLPQSIDGYITVTYTPYRQYTLRYDYTGTTEYWKMPQDVVYFFVQAYGASGSSTPMGQGGRGGYMAANVTLRDMNDNFWPIIKVGGAAGFNGGGSGGGSNCAMMSGGVGGGATSVATATRVYYNLVVAGGGGGAGHTSNCATTDCASGASINGGIGGTLNTCRDSPYPPSSDSPYVYPLQGGEGKVCGAGGGGGGCPGGEGGASAGVGGGGGGSTVVPVFANGVKASLVSYAVGVNEGNGYLLISFQSALWNLSDDDDDDDVNIDGNNANDEGTTTNNVLTEEDIDESVRKISSLVSTTFRILVGATVCFGCLSATIGYCKKLAYSDDSRSGSKTTTTTTSNAAKLLEMQDMQQSEPLVPAKDYDSSYQPPPMSAAAADSSYESVQDVEAN